MHWEGFIFPYELQPGIIGSATYIARDIQKRKKEKKKNCGSTPFLKVKKSFLLPKDSFPDINCQTLKMSLSFSFDTLVFPALSTPPSYILLSPYLSIPWQSFIWAPATSECHTRYKWPIDQLFPRYFWWEKWGFKNLSWFPVG